MCIGCLLFLHLFCQPKKSPALHTHSTSHSSQEDLNCVHSEQAVPTAHVRARSGTISTMQPACHARAGTSKTRSETDHVSPVQAIPQAYPVPSQPINVSVKPVTVKLDPNACHVRRVRIKVLLETPSAGHVPEIRLRLKEPPQSPAASVLPDSPGLVQGPVFSAPLQRSNPRLETCPAPHASAQKLRHKRAQKHRTVSVGRDLS